MALVSFPNFWGYTFDPYFGNGITPNSNARIIDAAGESVAALGKIILTTGPGTSKTISPGGGGKIYITTGTLTFANAGTTIRVGIQDLASGIEDDTYDVYGDLVGGGGGLTASTINEITMGTGTKTIAHGDKIAVVIEAISRAGADTIQIPTYSSNVGLTPYCTIDAGAGPVRNAQTSRVTILFDDGTLGWFGDITFAHLFGTSSNFNQTSTPDEYVRIFQVPQKIKAQGIIGFLNIGATARNGDIHLCTDPLGTPTNIRTISIVGNDTSGTTGRFVELFTSLQQFDAGTIYGLSFAPTTTGNWQFNFLDFVTFPALRGVLPGGTNSSMASRTNLTGAFGSDDNTKVPIIGPMVSQISDDAGGGGGGGEHSAVF